MGEKYYEIEKNESKHVARQAGFIKIDATEILTGKKEHFQLSSNGKVDAVEIVKVPTQVQYIDKPSKMLVLADAEFNTIEVPMALCEHVAAYLEPGMQVTLVRDVENSEVVKCLFPTSVLMQVRTGSR